MRKMKFQTQIKVCFGIFIICCILTAITKQGVFLNLTWIIWGLFFAINPVWPTMCDYADHSKLKLGSRIGGILVIILGLITHFGV